MKQNKESQLTSNSLPQNLRRCSEVERPTSWVHIAPFAQEWHELQLVPKTYKLCSNDNKHGHMFVNMNTAIKSDKMLATCV